MLGLDVDAWPKLADLPLGRFYVCEASPHPSCCNECGPIIGEGGEERCSYARWDVYGVRNGPFFFEDPKTKKKPYWDTATISGFSVHLNGIVLSYIGRFCTSTYIAFINPGIRADWCNYCRAWGHQFDFDGCTLRVEKRMVVLAVEAREARDEERRCWLRARTWPPLN